KPLIEATVEACTLRFRPILMTGLAFVCGVLPMVIAKGAGGASQQALGTSVMGGMIASDSGAVDGAGVLRQRAARAGGGPGEGGGGGGRDVWAAGARQVLSRYAPRRRDIQYSVTP